MGEPRVSDLCQQVREEEWMTPCLSQWLCARLEPSNALGFWVCGHELFLERLQQEAWLCIVSLAREVFREEELLELPAAILSRILDSDELTCREEEVGQEGQDI